MDFITRFTSLIYEAFWNEDHTFKINLLRNQILHKYRLTGQELPQILACSALSPIVLDIYDGKLKKF